MKSTSILAHRSHTEWTGQLGDKDHRGESFAAGGEGNPGSPRAQPGDLYVLIKVNEHHIFERRENDLHCTVPINLAQAVLGAEIETFDGTQLATLLPVENSRREKSVFEKMRDFFG